MFVLNLKVQICQYTSYYKQHYMVRYNNVHNSRMVRYYNLHGSKLKTKNANQNISRKANPYCRKDVLKWHDATMGSCFTHNHEDGPFRFRARRAGIDYGVTAVLKKVLFGTTKKRSGTLYFRLEIISFYQPGRFSAVDSSQWYSGVHP